MSPISESFPLFGTVYDTLGRPVSHATLEIVDGARAGETVSADARGRFEFDGQWQGVIAVRASKIGYVAETKHIAIAATQNPHYVPYFKLQHDGPTINLAGALRLRFQIDLSCAENVPAAFWTREYTARVPSHASHAVFSLQGGAFETVPAGNYGSYGGGSTVYASFFGQEAQFYMEDPPLQEVVSASERFAIYGHASGTISGRETSLPFRGTFSYCLDGEYDCEVCQSAAHVLTVIRE